MLFKYNKKTGVYEKNILTNHHAKYFVKVDEEKMSDESKEENVEKKLNEPVLPIGLTDVEPPADMSICPGISPIFDKENNKWIEDKKAIEDYKSTLPKQSARLTFEQMDDVLTYLMNNAVNEKIQKGLLTYLKKK